MKSFVQPQVVKIDDDNDEDDDDEVKDIIMDDNGEIDLVVEEPRTDVIVIDEDDDKKSLQTTAETHEEEEEEEERDEAIRLFIWAELDIILNAQVDEELSEWLWRFSDVKDIWHKKFLCFSIIFVNLLLFLAQTKVFCSLRVYIGLKTTIFENIDFPFAGLFNAGPKWRKRNFWNRRY